MIRLLGMGSPNVLKVILMLEELGLDYRPEWIDVMGGDQHGADFRRLSPIGKVPVLVEFVPGEAPLAIAESGAILLYLAETRGAFLASDGAERYAALQWLMIQMASLGPAGGQAIHFNAVAKDQPYSARRFGLDLDRVLVAIERRLGDTPYLAGEAYSIADMAVFPWVRTAGRILRNLGIGDHTARWFDAIKQRSATRAALAISDAWTERDRARFRLASPVEMDRYFNRSPALS